MARIVKYVEGVVAREIVKELYRGDCARGVYIGFIALARPDPPICFAVRIEKFSYYWERERKGEYQRNAAFGASSCSAEN